MTPHLKTNLMVYRLTVENFVLFTQFAQFFNFTESNCYTIAHVLTHSVSLAFRLNRASKINVGIEPGSGFKMRPVCNSDFDKVLVICSQKCLIQIICYWWLQHK